MQQTLYTPFAAANTDKTIRTSANTATLRAEIVRWFARKWDLLAILVLMAASLAYGIFAVAPVA
jgi:hypothetical protein